MCFLFCLLRVLVCKGAKAKGNKTRKRQNKKHKTGHISGEFGELGEKH
ncbi:hypothetical protein FORC93_b002 (plasmid) [Salmonella enterica subsp. enterica serovar Braenderup]|nr:hypothetical protein FORC93_b002 [Salmonella enterica subsp. enterica serovar Braenderup]